MCAVTINGIFFSFFLFSACITFLTEGVIVGFWNFAWVFNSKREWDFVCNILVKKKVLKITWNYEQKIQNFFQFQLLDIFSAEGIPFDLIHSAMFQVSQDKNLEHRSILFWTISFQRLDPSMWDLYNYLTMDKMFSRYSLIHWSTL